MIPAHPASVSDSLWRPVLGMLWAFGGVALFSVVFASGRLLGGAVPAEQILFLRFGSGALFLLMLALASPEGLRGCASPKPWQHLLRCALGMSGGLCAIKAATLLPVADAAALGLLEGPLTVLFGAILLAERVGMVRWMGVALTLFGALVVARDGLPVLADLLRLAVEPGAVLAVGGAALMGLENILIRLGAIRERPLAILLHVNVFGLLLLAPVVLPRWVAMDGATVALVLALGPLAIAGQFCNIRGYALAEASVIGPVATAWLPCAALIDWIAFDIAPGPALAAGGMLMLVGAMLLTRSRRRKVQVA